MIWLLRVLVASYVCYLHVTSKLEMGDEEELGDVIINDWYLGVDPNEKKEQENQRFLPQ